MPGEESAVGWFPNPCTIPERGLHLLTVMTRAFSFPHKTKSLSDAGLPFSTIRDSLQKANRGVLEKRDIRSLLGPSFIGTFQTRDIELHHL